MHDLRALLKTGIVKESGCSGKEVYRREWITVFPVEKSGSIQWL